VSEGESRLVVVTGGTGGLGLGVSEVLVEAGFRVVVTWIVEAERERAAATLGPEVELVRADMTDPGSADALASELDGRGGAWGLVHLVGGYRDDDPVAGMAMEDWDVQVALNLRSAAVALRAFLPGMAARGGGRAVAVSSRAALRPFAGAAAYAASKAGVIALVEAASEEVKQQGVCVNSILPGVIDTPANRRAMPRAEHGRWVAPREIGAVIRFLCSPDSSAVTGAAIRVYGRS
jgi:NAD(P)-dependent dehydrogenase (short-subunit alcohol dehydrogenase family)